MLTKADIDWMKSEIVPAFSDQVKKDISAKITLIRGLLETNSSDQKTLKKRVSSLEQKLQIIPAV